jgi:dihydroorotase
MHYKSPDNSVHFLDDDSFAHLLPAGSVPISDTEAEALRPKTELTYAQKRAAEYPPMTDYLDGVVKDDQVQIAKYIADCQAVKAKYPKGETP